MQPADLNTDWLRSVSLREQGNWVQLRAGSLEVRALTAPASYEHLQKSIYLSAPDYEVDSITPNPKKL